MPGPRSGLASSLGFGKESVYGTYVPATKFVEFNKADLGRKKNIAQGQGLAAGRSMMHQGRRVQTTREVDGSVNIDVVNRGLGLLWANLFGGASPTPTLVPSKASSYTSTFTFGDQTGLSLSMQLGVPPVDKAAAQAFSVAGCKITEAELSCELNGILTAALTIDGQEIYDPTDVGAKTLTAASYPTSLREFVGTDWAMTITPSSTGTPVPLQGVRKASVKVSRSQDTERFYVNGGRLKAEPIANGFQAWTGSLSADYWIDAAGTAKSLASLFAADESFALTWTFTGNLIEAGVNDSWSLTLPACYLDDQTPTVDGPGVISNDYPFTVLTNDAGAVPTLTVVSADSAL